MHRLLFSLRNNFSLEYLNGFRLPVKAYKYIEIYHPEAFEHPIVREALSGNFFVIGDGTNTLFVGDFPGCIIKICDNTLKAEEKEEEVWVEAGASLPWNALVHWAVARNLYGIENLVSIPGTCGAAPVQNIGAYGQEFSLVSTHVLAFSPKKMNLVHLSPSEMMFEYRNSIFKKQENEYLIVKVGMKLRKRGTVNLSYAGILETLSSLGIHPENATPREVATAIHLIRRKKLPDPALIPNCGSFFKNPEITSAVLEDLRRKIEGLPFFPVNGRKDLFRIPAAFLIEKCGWKGRRMGKAGVSPNHALVIVNYEDTTGEDILRLAMAIRRSVYETFGIVLQPEVKIVNSIL